MSIIASILRNERRDTEPLLSIYVAMASTCKGIHGSSIMTTAKIGKGKNGCITIMKTYLLRLVLFC
ncbi:hypothetical protein QPK13_06205 [Photorhabdus tasmaniensis]